MGRVVVLEYSIGLSFSTVELGAIWRRATSGLELQQSLKSSSAVGEVVRQPVMVTGFESQSGLSAPLSFIIHDYMFSQYIQEFISSQRSPEDSSEEDCVQRVIDRDTQTASR